MSRLDTLKRQINEGTYGGTESDRDRSRTAVVADRLVDGLGTLPDVPEYPRDAIGCGDHARETQLAWVRAGERENG
jgi:hypothetical protein